MIEKWNSENSILNLLNKYWSAKDVPDYECQRLWYVKIIVSSPCWSCVQIVKSELSWVLGIK